MEGSGLTNELEFPEYLFDDEETEQQWHFPELVRSGRLSPQFDVYILNQGQDQVDDAASKFSRRTYVWNGKYYVRLPSKVPKNSHSAGMQGNAAKGISETK